MMGEIAKFLQEGEASSMNASIPECLTMLLLAKNLVIGKKHVLLTQLKYFGMQQCPLTNISRIYDF